MLATPINLGKINFLTSCSIRKNGKNQNFLDWNANGLEIKRRGMTFLIPTFIFIMTGKNPNL